MSCGVSGMLQWKVAGRAVTLRWGSMGAPTASQTTANLPANTRCAHPPDAHGLVKGDLKRGALILRADHRLQLLGVHGALNLCEQSGYRLNLFRRLALQEAGQVRSAEWSGPAS